MGFSPKKFIKISLIGTAIVLLLFVLIGAFKPDYSFEVEVQVEAPVEETFFTFNDTLRISEWLAHVEEVQLVSGQVNKVGSQYKLAISGMENSYEVTKEITDFVPNELVAYKLQNPAVTVLTEVHFDPTDRGTHILAHHTVTGNNSYWKSMLIFLHSQIREKVEDDFARLKQLVEADS